MTFDSPLFDADNHYYEVRDSFTRYIEPRFAHKAVHAERRPDGSEVLMVGDKPHTFLTEIGDLFDTCVAPGSLAAMLRSMSKGGGTEATYEFQPIQPEYVSREARLALMDRQGVEGTFMFPSTGVTVEHFMKDDPEQLYANFRAFNRWVDDEWGFAHQNRIFAPPMISLLDRDEAIKDLEWALDRGARMIAMRPGPAYGRSPADPHFDAFWARADEAKLAVAFHISESGYNELYSVAWGEAANPSSHRQSAFQWSNFYGDRPIMDTIAALIFHNFFGRFPGIRVLSVENGSLWVRYLIKQMDKMGGMGRNGPWIGGRITERPSEIFRRHVYVSPYHEEPIPELVDLIGVDRVVFGSDFPHCEGLAEPRDYTKALVGLADDDVRKIMRDNARQLVGLA
jgi:predicted TIM-barrel fold metal-dependent hydrolase